MSLFRRRDAVTHHDLIPSRLGGGEIEVKPSTTQAMRSSVLWAGLHLRSSLVGMMPVDVYRKLPDGTRVSVPTPAVLEFPDEFADGKKTRISQWLYASEMALGGWGNSLGIVHSTTGNKTPAARVELVPMSDVAMRIRGTKIVEYKFGGEVVMPEFVWHERRHLLPGTPVGMSAVLHGAMAINGGLAANRFMGNWFANQAIPAAWFRNSEKTVNRDASRAIKTQFAESLKAGDMLVTGKDWEYTALQAKGVESGFLDAINASSRDLCRFVGVPGDMIDVPVDGSSITYANITQRNLQLLTINMGPDIKDHEDALTPLAAAPRYVKLNRSVVLAMDDKTRAEVLKMRIDSRTLTPDQARALDDQPPLAPADYEQFDRLFGSKNLQPDEGSHPGMTTMMTTMADAAAARSQGYRQRGDRPSQRRSPGAEFSGLAHVAARAQVELREAGESGLLTFEGYASVYEAPYEMWDMWGPYTEVVSTGAAGDLTRADLDVPLVLAHDQLRRIARTTNGTLELSQDERGLRVLAPSLDPADVDVAYIAPKLRAGLIDEMSFAFRIELGMWSPDYTEYRIERFTIHRGDVAIVGFGANPSTAGSGLREAPAVEPERRRRALDEFMRGSEPHPKTLRVSEAR